MTDQNAPGAVRDALIGAMGSMTDIHMNAPLDTIVRAGQVRARRQRHRRLGVAGAAAAVAAVPAAALLLANGHQASHQVAGPASGNAAARLTAWTVETAADGRLVVTIRELRDPAGLQRTLRADGVPASVTFLGRPNAACTPYEPAPVTGAGGLLASGPAIAAQTKGVIHVEPGASPSQAPHFTIDPAALPAGTGLQIGAESNVPGEPTPARARGWIGLQFGLVHTSSQCTGS
jgi:hypothetical protein